MLAIPNHFPFNYTLKSVDHVINPQLRTMLLPRMRLPFYFMQLRNLKNFYSNVNSCYIDLIYPRTQGLSYVHALEQFGWV